MIRNWAWRIMIMLGLVTFLRYGNQFHGASNQPTLNRHPYVPTVHASIPAAVGKPLMSLSSLPPIRFLVPWSHHITVVAMSPQSLHVINLTQETPKTWRMTNSMELHYHQSSMSSKHPLLFTNSASRQSFGTLSMPATTQGFGSIIAASGSSALIVAISRPTANPSTKLRVQPTSWGLLCTRQESGTSVTVAIAAHFQEARTLVAKIDWPLFFG
ncbi:MAG: hypothetical protein M1294_12405 [Firmicutes bacterium]|jgi:hypothetical protein|nr:hypothetical protein [Bacillota bacterium]MCL5014582.1 hypothetical protein [Bacillota bacterium]